MGFPDQSAARRRASPRLPRSSQYLEKPHRGASKQMETPSKAGTTIDAWDRSKHSIKLGLLKLRGAKIARAPGARCHVCNGIYAYFDKPRKNQAPSQLVCQPAEIAGALRLVYTTADNWTTGICNPAGSALRFLLVPLLADSNGAQEGLDHRSLDRQAKAEA